MKKFIAAFALLFTIIAVAAELPMSSGPDLDYVPVADTISLPAGMNTGAVSGVAINSKGHIFLLTRSPQPLMEFDADGIFIRALGEGFFDRPHGLRIDAQDNIWTADGGSHVVYRMNPQGRITLVLGVRGSAGEWHEAGVLRLFNEPNDVAIAPTGEIFVTQGHGKADSRVLKFDRDGNFVKTWGGKGTEPGKFDVPHSIVIDDKGLIYIADRGNQRIQVFDSDGNFIRQSSHPGRPAGLYIAADKNLYLANGHNGQILKLDMNGKVLGVTGKAGKSLGQFGEAHFLALTPKLDIYVADTLNWRVQKYVKK